MEKLLLQMEEGGWIDPRYKFCKVNNGLNLLGQGGFSCVYEMYDAMAPEKRYAAKVIGPGKNRIDERLIVETTQIQYSLSRQSDNIMRVIALWMFKMHLDDEGNLTHAVRSNQAEYEEDGGLPVQIVLMEKLCGVLSKDKFGRVELTREELKTEDGVIRFAENVGRALFTVHNNQFLHRDVKLENIFWDENLQQYKLGDFGIARYVGQGTAETLVFTDGYGAPEIERQLAKSYNLTADVYSFGITLYLLLNDLKFPASDGYHANIVQYSKDFAMPAPAHASGEMARIIRKMCSYRVQDRYQSVEEVLMDIGRLDGSYTDEGFTEYEDLETETYREEKDETVADDEKREMTREERKKQRLSERKDYSSASIRRMILTAVLTVFLFKSFSPEASYLNRWEFWILPLALLAAAVLQRVKEFNVEWSAVTIGAAAFSMYYLGVDLPQIAAIIAVLIGIPSITAGVSIGTGLWIAQMLTGKWAWVDFFSRRDWGWLVLIALAAVLESAVLLRRDYKKAGGFGEALLSLIMDNIWYLMIIAGGILLLLAHFKGLEIPDTVRKLHLIRTGIGIFIVELFYMWYHGDESLDE